MGYGLYVQTSNGILQLDSDQTWKYEVAIQGSASSWRVYNDEVLFVKFPTPTSGTTVHYHRHVSADTSNYEDVQIRYTGTTTAVTLDYALLKPVINSYGTPSSNISPDTSQTYGLQVYNASNVIVLDTRTFSNAQFEPSAYYEKGSLVGWGTDTGTLALATSEARLSTGFTNYYSTNWSRAVSAGVGNSQVEGWNVANNYYRSGGSIGPYTGVYYKNLYTAPFVGTVPVSNFADILVGGSFNA